MLDTWNPELAVTSQAPALGLQRTDLKQLQCDITIQTSVLLPRFKLIDYRV
jgi:hypothetical protein